MLTHSFEIRVAFGHCDPAQMVFYPNYFTWFDDATWRLFEHAGLGRQTLRQQLGIFGFPLVESTGRFHAPARDGDLLVLESHIARWGNRSFDVAHRASRDGLLVASGLESRVWAALSATEPMQIEAVPIPDEVKQRLGAAPASPAAAS